jgi:hypothetical protein
LTVYDAETRSEVLTDQNKAALRSFELADVPPDAPVGLYFGPVAPDGPENQWVKTLVGAENSSAQLRQLSGTHG